MHPGQRRSAENSNKKTRQIDPRFLSRLFVPYRWRKTIPVNEEHPWMCKCGWRAPFEKLKARGKLRQRSAWNLFYRYWISLFIFDDMNSSQVIHALIYVIVWLSIKLYTIYIVGLRVCVTILTNRNCICGISEFFCCENILFHME